MSSYFDKRERINLGVDAVLVVFSYYSAFFARFDGALPQQHFRTMMLTMPLLLATHLATAYAFKIYDIMWRYVSIWDMLRIAAATSLGSAALFTIASTIIQIHIPYTIYPLSLLMLLTLRIGVRTMRRVVHELKSLEEGKRILVFGAGDAGEMIVRDMKYNNYYGYTPIGFIDDDSSKNGRLIHGIPVLGSRHDLPQLMEETKPEEVLIAMPRVSSDVIREVVKHLQPYPVSVKILPSMRDLIDGTVSVAQMRNISLEDLLARPPVELDSEMVHRLIKERAVMVTGAGGSIGSELCRQVARLGATRLIMYERHENSLYTVEKELSDLHGSKAIVAVLGDVCDRNRISETITSYGVHIILHAAAHKHVPLMELNPSEAIKNNVRGTRILVEAAVAHKLDRFLLVSTDKAVNPCNVMGASKRIAEMLVKAAAQDTGSKFGAVRFGNVLGSSGSVIPRFLEQIKRGGPVTVTHPDIRRFFMLIPEAVQLILHAATIIEPGSIYALEMGEQMKIVDLACHLIRLSGYIPHQDIEVRFTGLRPGEKLFEELVAANETAVPSAVNNIGVVHDTEPVDVRRLTAEIEALEYAADAGNEAEVTRLTRRLVPTFGNGNSLISDTNPGWRRSNENTAALPMTNFATSGPV